MESELLSISEGTKEREKGATAERTRNEYELSKGSKYEERDQRLFSHFKVAPASLLRK